MFFRRITDARIALTSGERLPNVRAHASRCLLDVAVNCRHAKPLEFGIESVHKVLSCCLAE